MIYQNVDCPLFYQDQHQLGSYILFGNDAINGEWPWQALIFRGSSSICGAVLIDPLWALTAAHCVE